MQEQLQVLVFKTARLFDPSRIDMLGQSADEVE